MKTLSDVELTPITDKPLPREMRYPDIGLTDREKQKKKKKQVMSKLSRRKNRR